MSKLNLKTFQNRKARFNYEILEKFEAGIVLNGNEVRSIRDGKVVLDNAYGVIKTKEVWIINLFVDLKNYKKDFQESNNVRPKKLLLSRREIEKISHKLSINGLTIVPLNLHFNKKGMIKLDIGVSKGRKKSDLREYKKDQDWKRQKQRIAKDL